MADQKSQARVDRLFSGQRRNEDITNLFLFARDRCDGRECVQEIGNFIAHHSERDKGIVTRETRDFFAIALFSAHHLLPRAPLIDFKALPPITADYLKATLQRTIKQHLRSETGLSFSKAHDCLRSIVKRLKTNEDGTIAIPSDINETESKLLSFLIFQISIRPAFDGERLVDEFIATLKSNGLVSKNHLKDVSKIKSQIVLFAMSVMHRSNIIVQDGSLVALYVRPSESGLDVGASVPVQADPPKRFACSMFLSTLDVSEHCSDELLALEDWSSVDLEVDQNGKLAILK